MLKSVKPYHYRGIKAHWWIDDEPLLYQASDLAAFFSLWAGSFREQTSMVEAVNGDEEESE